MKKGFTLIELLGVIIILGLLGLIVFPNVSKSIKNSKEKLYYEQVDLILNSARTWGTQNNDSLNNENYVSLDTLMNEGYITKKEIKDPRTEEDMNGCIVISYDENRYQYKYSYVEETCEEVQAGTLVYTPDKCFTFDETTGTITNYLRDDEDCGVDIVIPESINGVTVKAIGYGAFAKDYFNNEGCMEPSKLINSVILPSGLESIGDSAFKGGESINEYCYVTINAITSVDFSRVTNLKSIGANAFYDNPLTNVEIPSSVTTIYMYSFPTAVMNNYYDTDGFLIINGNLLDYTGTSKEVVIPEGVTSIGSSAFYNNQLTTITIPNSVTSIGNEAFSRNQLTSVTIPSSITSIGNNAFAYNKLTSVTIPSGVTSIGAYAFGENQLTSVDIPSSVSTIYMDSFPQAVMNNYYDTDGFLIINGNLLDYTGTSKDVVIPEGVTSIGYQAFWANQLTSVEIPDSVTSIGAVAFYGNELTSVTIPNSVTSIGASAFYGNELTSVVIPNSVTSIGYDAFSINQLTSVTIKGKSSSTDFTSYPSSTPFGWADGYSDSNIIWNG